MKPLADPLPKRINLGCGYDVRPGWLNVDLVERHGPDLLADVTSLPMLPDGYFDNVTANDVLEHIERGRTVAVLAEWSRLLAPDGVMCLNVPSFLHLAGWALSPGYDDAMVIHLMFGTQAYQGDYHLTSFTPSTLERHLADVGLSIHSIGLMDGWLYEIEASRHPPEVVPCWPPVPLIEHIAALEKERDAMLASTSWRISAPLRAIATSIRSRLGRS